MENKSKECIDKVISYVNRNKGKKIPIDKFKDISEGVIVGYETTHGLLIVRVPKPYGWIHDVLGETDVIVYTRFKLSNYNYVYVSAFNFIFNE